MKKYLVMLMLLVSFSAYSQDLDSLKAGEKYEVTEADYANTTVEMADVMRSNGKIYVVVAVVMILFAGMVIYMVRIDRNISKLEKEVFNEKVNS